MDLVNKSFGTIAYDRLLVDQGVKAITKAVTLKAGQGTLLRGTVLGLATKGAISSAAGTNTGNGTIGTLSLGNLAKTGAYKVTCITKVSNAGVFSVVDPDGNMLQNAVVAVAYVGPVNFTIADGSTDFEVGDSFTLIVAAGSGLAYKVLSTLTTGAQSADCILADDYATGDDAGGDNVIAEAYKKGMFNRNKLIFGGSDVVATHEETLRDKGIYLSSAAVY